MAGRSMIEARAMRVDDEETVLSEEDLLSGSDSQPVRHSRFRLAAAVFGTTALLACAYLFASTAWSQDDTPPEMPTGHTSARALLESDELAEAVTDNVMKQGFSHLAPWERDNVKALAREKFFKVSQEFHTHDKDGSRALDEVSFNGEQRQAVLRVLRSLSDPRMQRMSLLVAHAVRDSESEDPAEIERHVAQSLRPHAEEIRQLLDVVRPEPLDTMAGTDGHLELDHDHIKILRSFGDNWDMQISATAPTVMGSRRLQDTTTPTPLYSADRAFSILRMLFDQCRVVIDIVRPAARLFGHDLHANPWITSAFGMADSIFNGVSCELDGAAHDMDTMEMASCPLRVASAASDALRWVLAKYNMIHYPSEGATPPPGSSEDSSDSDFSDFFDGDD